MSSKVREQGEKVRNFILKGILAEDGDVVPSTMKKFDITRQAVNKHIGRLQKPFTLQGLATKVRAALTADDTKPWKN